MCEEKSMLLDLQKCFYLFFYNFFAAIYGKNFIPVTLPSLGQLYSALEGREHLKGQLEVMFKKRTLN